MQDIRRGLEVALALGRADAGQAAVVQQGVVLAIEAAEGTDRMVARAGGLQQPGPAACWSRPPSRSRTGAWTCR